MTRMPRESAARRAAESISRGELFSRGRKGLRLTAAGEALLLRVKTVMDELSAARTEIQGLGDTHTGTVRIGLNETIARDFFAGFLKFAFFRLHGAPQNVR